MTQQIDPHRLAGRVERLPLLDLMFGRAGRRTVDRALDELVERVDELERGLA